MPNTHILVAEDDAVLRNLYVKKFTAAGFQVRIAEDGQKTIDEIMKETPALLLLDIHMPKADGFEVMKQFPKPDRTFPIILLTNFDQEEFKVRAEELGADDYFVKKDMTIRSLVEMVQRLLHKPAS
ncbi:MAG: two-component system, NtrC family, response regulator AtoC [Candidatus Peregrinibacteria bacterium Greene0416_19]|nr:MAG: two-component system, NtrC family, response regulator AtoC [Candidatus Peregrinibacteria bacterium Greene0416_19]